MNFTSVEDLQEYVDSFYSKFAGKTKTYNLFDSALDKNLIPTYSLTRSLEGTIQNNHNNLGYSDPYGLNSLKSFIAGSIFDSKVKPDDLIVTSGSQEALYLAFSDIKTTHKNPLIALEAFTYIGVRHIINQLGLKTITLPENFHRLSSKELSAFILKNHITALYLIPDLQNPTGINYSNRFRSVLFKLQEDFKLSYIYDACYRELIPLNKQNNIFRFATPQNYIVGSFSKTISPNLRIGWLCHPNHTKKHALSKRAINLFQSTLIQQAVSDLFSSGKYRLHLNYLRLILHLKHQFVRHCLHYFGFDSLYSYPHTEFGYYLWLTPNSSSVSLDIEKINQFGVLVAPGSFFSGSKSHLNHLRLCVSQLSPKDLYQSLSFIAQSILPQPKSSLKDRQQTLFQIFKIGFKIYLLTAIKKLHDSR